ncbi:hypothetical protein [Endozoicomonas sp. ALD040]|uniref:hypothetical protein n=1 Tax=unclassified Endozoicomonas TaxID=2644528 RepID=UPI003BAEE734
MKTTTHSTIKLFYIISFLLALASSERSYSFEFNYRYSTSEYRYSTSETGAQLTVVSNGVQTTYHGWRATIRSIPTLAGVSILIGGTFLTIGAATAVTGISIAALPVTILYGCRRGFSLVLRATRNLRFPPPGANAELDVPPEFSVNSSLVVPINEAIRMNEEDLSILIDNVEQQDTYINRQEDIAKIINYSGASSTIYSTFDQLSRQTKSAQIKNYIVLLTVENNSKENKPRGLTRHDVDLMLSNRTFLYHASETDLIEHNESITHCLLDNIKRYSINISKEQFEGCFLYFMMSDHTARIIFVPFS